MRILNRPMFKKGGSSKGTGVMSMVEPRENFSLGTTIENIRNLQAQYQTELMKAAQPSAGEKAALIAQIASTPGGLYEKITSTLPIQTQLFAQQRALKPELTKQKIAGEIDIAKLEAAGATKAGAQEKAYSFAFNKYKQLRDAGIKGYKGKSDSELSELALEEAYNKFRTRRAPEDVDSSVVLENSEMYNKLINKLNDAISRKDQNEYNLALARLKTLQTTMEVAGLSQAGTNRLFGALPPFPLVTKKKKKDGGRIQMAEGGDPNVEENIIETVAEEKDPTPVGTELKSFTYDELRGRLPKEVSNDIVTLLATSQEALEDFAYITTQSDIGNFNQKYGVNLTLPVSE
jgi:hypothetical protein